MSLANLKITANLHRPRSELYQNYLQSRFCQQDKNNAELNRNLEHLDKIRYSKRKYKDKKCWMNAFARLWI